jgi:pantoate--beta-alanine ligase
MLDKDVELLKTVGEVLVFAPSFRDVYPENDVFTPLDLGGLDEVLEGKFRPGHFQGVVHVVRNLFEIVRPDRAFFGLKDFQQLAIIKKMVDILKFPIEIVPCPTTREESGLALSSRNLRLNDIERENALIIYKTLQLVASLRKDHSPAETLTKAIDFFNTGELTLEYIEIVDSESLKVLSENWGEHPTCCIAAFCGEVRLIDNIQI